MTTTEKRNPRDALPSGVTPHQAGRRKREAALSWILHCDYSTEAILRQKLGIAETGYAAELARKGLLQIVQTPAIRGNRIYKLTDDGLSMALSRVDDLVDYDTDPLQIRHQLIKHSLAVQTAVLALPRVTRFLPERLIEMPSTPGGKRPDALIETESARGVWFAVEVELTPKRGRILDQTMLSILQAIEAGRYAGVVYVTNIPGIVKAYQAHLNAPITTWARDPKSGRWYAQEKITFPERIRSRVRFVVSTNLLKGL